jgi:hypothetical protein
MNWQIITLILIAIFAFSPFIVLPLAVIFGYEIDPNSPLAATPWAIFFTVPIGVVMFLVWLATILYLELNK